MADKQYEEVLGRTRATEPHPDHLNSFEYHVLQKSLLDLSDRLDKLEAGAGKVSVKTEEPPFKVGDVGYFYNIGSAVYYGVLLEVFTYPHEPNIPRFVHKAGFHSRCFSLTPPQLDEQNRAMVND